jgi:hypothetical protein
MQGGCRRLTRHENCCRYGMKKRTDEIVDEGVKETFPASDPVAAAQPDSTASERVRRGGNPPAPTQPPKRSPDWLLEKK